MRYRIRKRPIDILSFSFFFFLLLFSYEARTITSHCLCAVPYKLPFEKGREFSEDDCAVFARVNIDSRERYTIRNRDI